MLVLLMTILHLFGLLVMALMLLIMRGYLRTIL
jgi:hypothetical protein